MADDTSGFQRGPAEVGIKFRDQPGKGDPTGGFAPGPAVDMTGGFKRGAAPEETPRPVEPTSGGSNPYLAKMVEPLTSYPSVYSKMNREAQDLFKSGVEDIQAPGSRAKGAAKMVGGAYMYTLSPINAALRTIVGQPFEESTHGVIKKEWPEFAASLALPVIGLAGTKPVQATANAIQRVLSPTTMSSAASDAAGLLRAEGGTAARDTAITENLIEPFHQIVNKLPDADRYDFINYVETRSSGVQLPAYMQKLQPIADTLRQEFDKRMAKIQAMPSHQQMSFITDYFPHMWKDPQQALRQAQNYSGAPAARQGSGLSMAKRSIPTTADGLGMGLEPITSNPLEMTMRYVQSMDRFIASQTVLDIAKENGTVKYFKPKFYGASGNPTSLQTGKIPDGWVPISGRGAENAAGAQAYAPEDWARVYNNFIDPGVYKNADWANIYDAARRTSNAVTALELGLSGFHALTIANEAYVNGLAKGVSEVAGGAPLRGLLSSVKAPAGFVTYPLKGKKVQDIYLGRSLAAPDYRKITELLERAGGRAAGKSHALDYDFSAAGNYWRSFQRGALGLEAKAAAQEIRQSPVMGTAKVATRQLGRTMDTVAAPLFEMYIPLVKNGAFYDNMSSWLKMHPNASQDQELAAARQIWDSIDNRFGEMVQDNIFWNKTLKQTSQLGMRSYSWNMGTIREIGGGVIDIGRTIAGQQEWSPRASYVVALPIAVATMNAAYQYLKTGEGARDIHDLVAGRTGGTAPGAGGRGHVEERISVPGYQKDVFGWYEDWWQEARNKMSTALRVPAEVASNRDWRNDPIISPEASAPEWMQQYFNYVTNTFGPISIKQMIQGKKKGSDISRFESVLGLNPARAEIQDPQGFARMMKAIHRREWEGKERHDRTKERQYGGTVE